jgi:hypothetical protein
MKRTRWIATALFIAAAATAAVAGDDPSIKGETRTSVQKAMNQHIEHNTIKDKYVIYDAVEGELKKLKFDALHKGIVRKGDFYVSCADFVDAQGKKYDIDFLVAEKKDSFNVLQALVHSIEGKKRPYHLEEEKAAKK